MDILKFCEICGGRAIGFQVGYIACRACVSFYKRAVKKKMSYFCYLGNCSVHANSAARCKPCRFRRCIDVGLTTASRRRSGNLGPERVENVCNLASANVVGAENSSISAVCPLSLTVQRTCQTASAVGGLVESVFGDELACWTANLLLVSRNEYTEIYSDLTANDMIAILRARTVVCLNRAYQFASHLPGVWNLDPTVIRHCMKPGWKKHVFWTVHHAVFMTDDNIYCNLPSDGFRCGRYWQNFLHGKELVNSLYEVCRQFREIGLEQTERYILLAMIILEPDDILPEAKVVYLHRFYGSTLLNLLKWRCADIHQLATTFRLLERFFSAFSKIEATFSRFSYDTNTTRQSNLLQKALTF